MIASDVRHAALSLGRTPSFTLTALVVLALGIGANTAIFSVVHGVLLQPLPLADPDRLIRIWSSREDRHLPFFSVSMPDFADWRERSQTLALVAAYERQQALTLRGAAEVEQVMGTRVSVDVLPLLGVPPERGRWLTAGDDRPGGLEAGAVISHGLWQRRFGGRPDILGQTLVLDDRPWTIVGVMPPSFAIPNAPSDVWLPLAEAIDPARRSSRDLRVLARVGEGYDVEAARRELVGIAAVLADERPESNRSWSVTVRPLVETVVSPEFRRSVLLLAGAVGFVLLIACANVTSLLLSRATTRRREMAIRTALGSSRAALIRLLLVENLMLSAAAGIAGVLLAAWGVEALKRVDVESIPRLAEVTLSVPVLAFAGLVSLLTALAFGVVPAFAASRDTATQLRTRDVTPDRRTSRSRDVLVLAEVAMAVVLLVGAGLMMRSFVRLQQRALGFDATWLLTVEVALPASSGRPRNATAVTERLIAEAAALPGVIGAAGGSRLPFAGPNSANVFEIEGSATRPDELPDTDYRVVTPEYFRVLGIPLIRGRAFTTSDGPEAPAVIISASCARYWADRDPIGTRVRLGDSPWLTVVGMVGNARYRELDQPGDIARSMMYVPHRQMPQVPLMLAMRTGTRPEALVDATRSALRRAAPEVPVVRIESMTAILALARGPQRFSTTLLVAFAWVAVVLAAAGLYGLIAYFVSSRAKEIGVRVTLGARASDIVRLTAGPGVVLSAAGLAIGLVGAWALRRVVGRMLFEVSPGDPATYATVAVGFLVVAAVASYLPARRALGIDPAQTLRAE